MRAGTVHTWLRLAKAERTFGAMAFALATPVGLGLRLVGFARMNALVARLPLVAPPTCGGVTPERGEVLVARAFAHAPATPGCLPQALVQTAVHRLLGRDVSLVIGVRRGGSHAAGGPVDFEAHA
jgi:hypothetical protein